MKLKDKVVVITGAGLESGFGWVIALEMAAEGGHVVVTDISSRYPNLPDYALGTTEDIEKRVAELKALGNDAMGLVCDVRSKTSVQAMVKAVVRKYGKINILVNNAGFVRVAPFLDIDEEIWDMHQDVMPKGTFLCSQAVVPEMKKTGERGKIINISSMAGLVGAGFAAAYCAAKFAQVGLTKALAQELAPQNINVNAICPGLMTQAHVGRQYAVGAAEALGTSAEAATGLFLSRMPMGRMGTPEDVAKAALFLASPDSDHITGVALEVSGGQR